MLYITQKAGCGIEVIRYGQGMEGSIFAAIDIASHDEQWLVIEDVQLAPIHFYYDLKYHLQNNITNKGKTCMIGRRAAEKKAY